MSISEPILSEQKLTQPAHATETAVSGGVNTTTKAELLSRAKDAIEAGEQSLHDAAEALGIAQVEHSASQREMAEAIGKSVAWVNALLQWRRSGYKDDSPFGPTTRAGRVQHAERRAKASKARRAGTEPKGEGDDAAASAAGRKAENAKLYGEPGTAISRDDSSATAGDDDAKALAEFKSAVDHWLSRMSHEAKCEAVNYVLKKSGVPVS
jgi:hypothetical protein